MTNKMEKSNKQKNNSIKRKTKQINRRSPRVLYLQLRHVSLKNRKVEDKSEI